MAEKKTDRRKPQIIPSDLASAMRQLENLKTTEGRDELLRQLDAQFGDRMESFRALDVVHPEPERLETPFAIDPDTRGAE